MLNEMENKSINQSIKDVRLYTCPKSRQVAREIAGDFASDHQRLPHAEGVADF